MDEQTSDPDRQASRMNRADFIAGLFFVLLGLVTVYMSWTMPRLEIRGIHPSTVPGIVPGLLGLLLTVCGVLVGLKGLAGLRDRQGWADFWSMFASVEAVRFAVVAGLALIYALVLVGRIPFWLATGLFVFAFIVAFEVFFNDTPRPLVRAMIMAAIQAVIVSGLVTAVFQYGFLVRLP
ncbi:tripartite tricarboxylate transporter TctB family protein [Pelagibacterium sp.]|uniref:tripartite tricarboxylate transporter TctB family protein n=1 Tax=Pelagibacterium sp. TaxID=1967288 RepID=UPI003A8F4313